MATLNWNDIPGWFTWPDIYDEAVMMCPEGGQIVELGTFCGRSACYLGTKVRESGKTIYVDTIDNFSRSFGLTAMAPLAFIDQCGLSDIVKLKEMHQLEAVGLYADKSLDFVFMDSDHSYQATKDALIAYLPKIKSGAVLAGDDYSSQRFPGVVRAVDEVIPGRVIRGSVFWYQVP